MAAWWGGTPDSIHCAIQNAIEKDVAYSNYTLDNWQFVDC